MLRARDPFMFSLLSDAPVKSRYAHLNSSDAPVKSRYAHSNLYEALQSDDDTSHTEEVCSATLNFKCLQKPMAERRDDAMTLSHPKPGVVVTDVRRSDGLTPRGLDVSDALSIVTNPQGRPQGKPRIVAKASGTPQEVETEDAEENNPETVTRGIPKKPSRAEVERHCVTHLPYRSWCDICVAGRGVDNPHRRPDLFSSPTERRIAQVSFDWAFFRDRTGGPLFNVLIGVDKKSSSKIAIQTLDRTA